MCPHMRTVLDSYCPLRIGGYDSEDEVRKPPAPGGAPGAAARVAGASSPHGPSENANWRRGTRKAS